ncbi:MAG: hypothetical protein JWM60_1273 [Solirubrobacterales bacterium]|nr:hypothetical protein [Solirubrobacterales bacterium]
MARRVLASVSAGMAILAAGLLPAGAVGSAFPPDSASAKLGVTALGGGDRYVARPRDHGTVIARIDRAGGRLERAFAGRLAVPAVALDTTASGLSADGRTLVLIHPRTTFPAPRTSMVVLDATTLRVRTRVALRGDFVFDAISPDGATLYLIRYSPSGNPTDYSVRAYDVPAHRLLAKPIVDPHEPDEKMRGVPVTRTTSPDGAWAYTLYDGGGVGVPFLHALDTRHRTARCINLPALAGDITGGRFRLSPDGRRLSVVDGATAVTTIDTRTFRVSAPALEAPRPAAAPSDGGGGSGVPWRVIAGLGVALLLAGAAFAAASRRSTRRYAGSDSPE